MSTKNAHVFFVDQSWCWNIYTVNLEASFTLILSIYVLILVWFVDRMTSLSVWVYRKLLPSGFEFPQGSSSTQTLLKLQGDFRDAIRSHLLPEDFFEDLSWRDIQKIHRRNQGSQKHHRALELVSFWQQGESLVFFRVETWTAKTNTAQKTAWKSKVGKDFIHFLFVTAFFFQGPKVIVLGLEDCESSHPGCCRWTGHQETRIPRGKPCFP